MNDQDLKAKAIREVYIAFKKKVQDKLDLQTPHVEHKREKKSKE